MHVIIEKQEVSTMNFDFIKQKQILLLDDELPLLEMVESILINDGYKNIKRATTLTEALNTLEKSSPDLALLDINLPDGSGFELMEKIRQNYDFPVLFLSARGEDEDRFYGFQLGADDYIVKPFLPQELLLRIGAILRRSYKNDSPLVMLEASMIDFEKAQVIKNEEIIPLTAKEFDLLTVLHRNSSKIVTIDCLCEAVWGDNPFGYENSLMAHIRRIREKIESNPSKPVSLVTIKGLGYKLITKER